jgi:hypothetical protein
MAKWKLSNSLRYLLYGTVANKALWLYYKAPRETLQDEFLLLHRWALKKAHTARMANECAATYESSQNL